MNATQSRHEIRIWRNLMRFKPVRLLLLCVVSGVMMLGLSGASAAQNAVTVVDREASRTFFTPESDPLEILRSQKISLGSHDTFTFSGLAEGQGSIQIHRASQIRVTADGRTHSVWMTGGTLAGALSRIGLSLGELDEVSQPLSTPIEGDMQVTIERVAQQTVEKKIPVPFETETIQNQLLPAGEQLTLQEGQDGERTLLVRQTLRDGRVTEEEVLEETLTRAPVAARVLVGNPDAPTSQLIPAAKIELDANGNPRHYLARVTGKATAYSALGKPTKLVPGCVAMDLSQYPRGSRLYIKTPDGSFIYGYSEVRDTGPAVNEGIILVDLFFGSYKESCLFGAKTVDIYILP